MLGTCVSKGLSQKNEVSQRSFGYMMDNLKITSSPEKVSCYFIYESESRSVMSNSLRPRGQYSPWNSLGQKLEWIAILFSRGIFPTQGLNPGLSHCRWILYQLSHKGSPGILEWVAYPFSRGSSWPRNQTMVSCVAGRFFTNWAIREARSPWLIGYQISVISGIGANGPKFVSGRNWS